MLHGSDQCKFFMTDRFHYELSFSKDNIQGVLYEPWHWRFVGDDHSLQTFYAQRKLAGLLTTCDTWQIISLAFNDPDHRLLHSLWGGALRPCLTTNVLVAGSLCRENVLFSRLWDAQVLAVTLMLLLMKHKLSHSRQKRDTCAGPPSTQIHGKPYTRILR